MKYKGNKLEVGLSWEEDYDEQASIYVDNVSDFVDFLNDPDIYKNLKKFNV